MPKPIHITVQTFSLTREWDHHARRATWATGGIRYTGRCCHMSALKAARAAAVARSIVRRA